MGVLSYIERWRGCLRTLSTRANVLFQGGLAEQGVFYPERSCKRAVGGFECGGASSAVAAADPETAKQTSSGDGTKIDWLGELASDPNRLEAAQVIAARKLLAYDKELYPADGCAITLSVLLQESGISVPDVFRAFDLSKLLTDRG